MGRHLTGSLRYSGRGRGELSSRWPHSRAGGQGTSMRCHLHLLNSSCQRRDSGWLHWTSGLIRKRLPSLPRDLSRGRWSIYCGLRWIRHGWAIIILHGLPSQILPLLPRQLGLVASDRVWLRRNIVCSIRSRLFRRARGHELCGDTRVRWVGSS